MSASQRPKLSLKGSPAPWKHHDFLKGLVGKKIVVKVAAGLQPQVAQGFLINYDQWTIHVKSAEDGHDAVLYKTHIMAISSYEPAIHDPIFNATPQQ